ncbi:unnamed protein product [Protopolystoma xenopodis]|uniref:Uncharacterized protein n=1 Tax=Protopolystoma xenopodis TaxID=117903 RepID=A0A3S5AF50_9PLAT|nr:unnamed protein product [Protopolystoma xenopodis]
MWSRRHARTSLLTVGLKRVTPGRAICFSVVRSLVQPDFVRLVYTFTTCQHVCLPPPNDCNQDHDLIIMRTIVLLYSKVVGAFGSNSSGESTKSNKIPFQIGHHE